MQGAGKKWAHSDETKYYKKQNFEKNLISKTFSTILALKTEFFWKSCYLQNMIKALKCVKITIFSTNHQ